MKKAIHENNYAQNNSEQEHSCSICGNLYHNFAFKGGYICESCLTSFKELDDSEEKTSETDPR